MTSITLILGFEASVLGYPHFHIFSVHKVVWTCCENFGTWFSCKYSRGENGGL